MEERKRKSSIDQEEAEASARGHEDIGLVVAGRAEKRKLKKVLKQQQQAPELVLKLENGPGEVKTKDIKDLILFILADGVNPKWIMVKHKQNLSRVVLLVLSELSAEVYADDKHLPKLKSLFKEHCEVQGPGEKRRLASPIQTLLQHPLSKEEKKTLSKQAEKNKTLGLSATFNDLLMSPTSLVENQYPTEDDVRSKGYLTFQEIPNAPKILAIDCEMCVTVNGLELTRISVVDDQHKPIYDTLVLPDDSILDYNTRFSGITKESLEGVKTRLHDVQQHLATIVSSETILVGHSLENDLRALKIFHERVIDTSLIYSHTRGPPFKASLKWLCEKYLGRGIQGKESGHDSIEDAQATMELVQLKLKNGLDFGLQQQDHVRLSVKLESQGKTMAVVDTKNMVLSFGQAPAESHICTNDREVADQVINFSSKKHLVYGRFTSLESFYRNESSSPGLETVLEELDNHVSRIYEALPANTAFIVVSGHGKVAEARRLLALKADSVKAPEEESKEDLGVPVASASAAGLEAMEISKDADPEPGEVRYWTLQDEFKLEEAVKAGRKGLGFFTVKPEEA